MISSSLGQKEQDLHKMKQMILQYEEEIKKIRESENGLKQKLVHSDLMARDRGTEPG
jgi:hypothetical protein